MDKKSKIDLSELTKKIDLNQIVDSIKSLVTPGGGTPEADPEDAIGVKLAQISILLQELAKNQEQQAKDFMKVNRLINGIYKDLQQFRQQSEEKTDETNASESKPKKKSRSSK